MTPRAISEERWLETMNEWQAEWKTLSLDEQLWLGEILAICWREAEPQSGGKWLWWLILEAITASSDERALQQWQTLVSPLAAEGTWWDEWYERWLSRAQQKSETENGEKLTSDFLHVLGEIEQWRQKTVRHTEPTQLRSRVKGLWQAFWRQMSDSRHPIALRTALWTYLQQLRRGREAWLPLPTDLLTSWVGSIQSGELKRSGLTWRICQYWEEASPDEQKFIQQLWIQKAENSPSPIREDIWGSLMESYCGSPAMAPMVVQTIQRTTSWVWLEMAARWKPEGNVDVTPLCEIWERKLRSTDHRVMRHAWTAWQQLNDNPDIWWALVAREIQWAASREVISKIIFWADVSRELAARQLPESRTGETKPDHVWSAFRAHEMPEIEALARMLLVMQGSEEDVPRLCTMVSSVTLQPEVVTWLGQFVPHRWDMACQLATAWKTREQWDAHCRTEGSTRLVCWVRTIAAAKVEGKCLKEENIPEELSWPSGDMEDGGKAIWSRLTHASGAGWYEIKQIIKRHWQEVRPTSHPEWSWGQREQHFRQEMFWLQRLGDESDVLNWLVDQAEHHREWWWNMKLGQAAKDWQPSSGWGGLWEQRPEQMSRLWKSIEAWLEALEKKLFQTKPWAEYLWEDKKLLLDSLSQMDPDGNRFRKVLEKVVQVAVEQQWIEWLKWLEEHANWGEKRIKWIQDIWWEKAGKSLMEKNRAETAAVRQQIGQAWGWYWQKAECRGKVWAMFTDQVGREQVPGMVWVTWLEERTLAEAPPINTATWEDWWSFLTRHAGKTVAAATWEWLLSQGELSEELQQQYWQALAQDEREFLFPVLATWRPPEKHREQSAIWERLWRQRLKAVQSLIRQCAWGQLAAESGMGVHAKQMVNVVLAKPNGRELGEALSRRLENMGDLAGQIYLWEGFIQRCRTSEEESLGKNILRGLMVKILATNHERENEMATWLERWGGTEGRNKTEIWKQLFDWAGQLEQAREKAAQSGTGAELQPDR
jgi:hypothetical protein